MLIEVIWSPMSLANKIPCSVSRERVRRPFRPSGIARCNVSRFRKRQLWIHLSYKISDMHQRCYRSSKSLQADQTQPRDGDHLKREPMILSFRAIAPRIDDNEVVA